MEESYVSVMKIKKVFIATLVDVDRVNETPIVMADEDLPGLLSQVANFLSEYTDSDQPLGMDNVQLVDYAAACTCFILSFQYIYS